MFMLDLVTRQLFSYMLKIHTVKKLLVASTSKCFFKISMVVQKNVRRDYM